MLTFHDWPWKPDPDYTRLLATLRRQGDPNRVTCLELFADSEFIAAMLGENVVPPHLRAAGGDRAAQERSLHQRIRFWHGLGFDALWITPLVAEPGSRLTSADTASIPKDRRKWVNETAGVITSMKDFENASWPKPEDINLHRLEFVAQHLPEGMGIFAGVRGVLEFVMELMGFETFCMALYDQPDLVEAMFAKQAEIYLPLTRAMAQMDRVIGVWMGDDMGYKTATMISPNHIRKYVFPLQKRYAEIAHEHEMPFLLHSCGTLDAIMIDLIDDVKVDAKHSFEDVIMPVEEFSARYSDDMAVIGGLDMNLLANGTEEQVRARTQEILAACMPTGSYILGSGNSIANFVRPENFLAMLDEGQRYSANNA